MNLIVAMGVADGRQMTDLAAEGASIRLAGNTGLLAALVPELARRGHTVQQRLLGRSGPLELRGAEVLLNGVCDASIHQASLARIEQWQSQTELPVVNRAGPVAACSRETLRQTLAPVPRLRVPHCTLYDGRGSLADHIQTQGHCYPVLLRPPGSHGSKALIRVSQASELPPTNGRAAFVTDFIDSRDGAGQYRKQRVVYVDGRLFARHSLVGMHWNVKGDARAYMADHPELVDAEHAFLDAALPSSDSAPEAAILKAFAHTGLDFGAVDYAVLPDGEVLIFEMNACFQLTGSIPESGTRVDWRYLERNNAQILDAVIECCTGRAQRGG